MVREIAISVYLQVFHFIFNLCKLFPQKQKTVGVATFGDNIYYTAQAIRKQTPEEEIIILKVPKCNYPFQQHIINKEILFSLKHPLSFVQSIYHLATATTVLVDNYYGFLAVTNFKPETTCIQLWHAAGAIKKFGLMDPSIKNRSKKAIMRFQQVYNKFHYTVVGSERMATIFRQSFNLPNESILRTGIPRTDVFYDKKEEKRISKQIQLEFPTIKDKKIILYAPTFRDKQLSNYQVQLDMEMLYNHLSSDYVLFVKLHPAISNSLINNYPNFVYDVSDYAETNHLLMVTDLLITDYSSIPFEYAIYQKPMIFYAYDLEEYKQERGIIQDYEKQMPGPVVTSTESIIREIKQNNFNKTQINAFANLWNDYSNGNASLQLANFITRTDGKEKKQALI
ncbi:CDP-glycerol glycerophosphotransferase family protein [Virgibacillus salarius]|uniref:CDP-glycerol glycerophosphotransferase family protein n=1 Tax=Virgibacillus salarius TaxID=447199 RepID=UPI000420A658|nr:CDP-glycerol glycerophosphotransferase family protein [Priestia megaterium]